MGQFERSLWVAPKSSHRRFGWNAACPLFGRRGGERTLGGGAASIYPKHGLVRLIPRRPQLQILSFSARALMMPSMNARLFMPHSQRQAIGSLSLWPASVSRYSVFGGTC
jgi:hypothetical protein